MNKDEQNNLLDAVAGVLIRCFFICWYIAVLVGFLFAGRELGIQHPFKMVRVKQA